MGGPSDMDLGPDGAIDSGLERGSSAAEGGPAHILRCLPCSGEVKRSPDEHLDDKVPAHALRWLDWLVETKRPIRVPCAASGFGDEQTPLHAATDEQICKSRQRELSKLSKCGVYTEDEASRESVRSVVVDQNMYGGTSSLCACRVPSCGLALGNIQASRGLFVADMSSFFWAAG